MSLEKHSITTMRSRYVGTYLVRYSLDDDRHIVIIIIRYLNVIYILYIRTISLLYEIKYSKIDHLRVSIV